MKKLFAVLLAILMMMTILPMAALADEVIADPAEAADIEPAAEHEHDYTGWNDDWTNMPTCTEDGSEWRICKTCGHPDTQVVPALGHRVSKWATVVEPKCETEGLKEGRCTRCRQKVREPIPALGHVWDEGTVTREPTCGVAGVMSYKCERGCERTDAIPATEDHSFVNYVSDNNATCTADGTKTAKCENCDATDTVPAEGTALGHSFTNYVSDNNAACTVDGTKTAKCDRCDETDTIPDAGTALGHSFTNYVSDDNATCTGNCTETAKCDRCDETHTRDIEGTALGHKWAEEFTVDKEPTCTEAGSKSKHCLNDGCEEKSEVTAIEALGHKWGEWKVTTDATCAKAGEETRVCEVCGGEETRELPMLPHQKVVTVKAKDPTCTEKGCTEGWRCEVCGKTEESMPVDELMHDWVDTIGIEPTCTKLGLSKGVKCSRCREWKLYPVPLPAKGHDYGDWKDSEDGKNHESVCKVCENAKTQAHKWELVEEKKPTYYRKGWKKYECEVCGATRTEELARLHRDWGDNPKTGDYIMIAVATMVLAGAGLAGVAVYTVKKKKK